MNRVNLLLQRNKLLTAFSRPSDLENMKGCSHGWDKEDVPGSWKSERKEQAYNFVIKFLKSVY